MQTLLNGNQFKKLLEKEYAQLQIEYGLKKIDIQILQYLGHAGIHDTAKDIVELGLFTKGHVSQSLAYLRRMNLIEVVRDEHDARCMHLILKQDAQALITQIEQKYQKVNDIMFKGMTKEEVETFKRLSRKVMENIHNAT